MQLNADYELEDVKNRIKLRQQRQLAEFEDYIIAQAKRDEEISRIEDEAARARAEQEVLRARNKAAAEDENTGSDFVPTSNIALSIGEMSLQILLESSKTENGEILLTTSQDQTHLVIGDENFISTRENRKITEIESALKELYREDLIEKVGTGDLYRVTHEGYRYIDSIKTDLSN